MTLATRCTACGTAFRVVQDQLKVANGWVRCGRCSHVFDASGSLFVSDGSAAVSKEAHDPAATSVEAVDATASIRPKDAVLVVGADADLHDEERSPTALEQPSSVPLPEVASAPAPDPASEAWPEPPRWLLASSVVAPTVVDIGIGSVAPVSVAAPDGGQAGPVVVDVPEDDDGLPPDFVDARFNEDLLAGLPGLRDPADGADDPVLHAVDPATATETLPGAVPAGADAEPHGIPRDADAAQPTQSAVDAVALDGTALVDDPTVPAFLRRRGRDDRQWQRRPVRIALGTSVALLTMAISVQAALHWRDWLAARWPATAPWLSAVCASAGCRVQPLRRIDDLGVDSTTLTPALPDSAALRLGIVLSNRGDLPLAAPSVELALTDASGDLVARKVLTPAEFHHTAGLLQPGSTTRWQTVLLASGERVVGYTVELFYP